MNDVIWFITGAAFSFLAMVWFSMAMQLNCKQVFGRDSKPKSMSLRSLAVLALMVSGLCCLQADHASMAILVWMMFVIVSAFSTGMLLSYRRAVVRILTPNFLIY